MIPEKVTFTGLTTSGLEMMDRISPPIALVPTTWDRVFCKVGDEPWNFRIPRKMEAWMKDNISGRWHAESVSAEESSFVIRFEDTTDAAMFRLKGGENAWLDE